MNTVLRKKKTKVEYLNKVLKILEKLKLYALKLIAFGVAEIEEIGKDGAEVCFCLRRIVEDHDAARLHPAL